MTAVRLRDVSPHEQMQLRNVSSRHMLVRQLNATIAIVFFTSRSGRVRGA